MNLLPFLAIPHHPSACPGSKSPIDVLRAEGPRVAAPSKQLKGLTRPGVGGWPCLPCSAPPSWHAAGCTCGRHCLPPSGAHPALVSLQFLSAAALKIEQRIRSLQRFFAGRHFRCCPGHEVCPETGCGGMYGWAGSIHLFLVLLLDHQPSAWGGKGRLCLPCGSPRAVQLPACRQVAAASPGTFLFCFSELKLLFPPDS